MGENIIITIGRNFGSNGREIGEKLAQEMEIPFYDRNLIEIAAKQGGLEWKEVGAADEKLIGGFLNFRHGLDFIQENPNDAIYMAQAEVIRSIYHKQESCVIVGRGADYVLRGRPEVLRVFIFAPLPNRIETVMERYHFSQEEAEKVVKHMDKQRRGYYEYFTDHNWDQKEGKDLLVNSSEFDIDEAVGLIRAAAIFKMRRGSDD